MWKITGVGRTKLSSVFPRGLAVTQFLSLAWGPSVGRISQRWCAYMFRDLYTPRGFPRVKTGSVLYSHGTLHTQARFFSEASLAPAPGPARQLPAAQPHSLQLDPQGSMCEGVIFPMAHPLELATTPVSAWGQSPSVEVRQYLRSNASRGSAFCPPRCRAGLGPTQSRGRSALALPAGAVGTAEGC